MTNNKSVALASLVDSCRVGDKRAWAELVDRIMPIIFSICNKMRLSGEESFDVFGQVSFLLLKNLNNLKSPEKVLAYVGKITRHEILRITGKANLFRHLDELIIEEMYNSSTETPEQIYQTAEEVEAIMTAVAMLPIKDFRMIQLLFLDRENLSYKEIAAKLDIPVSSIGPTRKRCLKKLMKIIKDNKLIS